MRRGFSIIEVFVAMGLMFVLMLGITLVIQTGARYLEQGKTASAVQQESMVAFASLEREFTNASSLLVNTGAANFPTSYIWFASPEQPQQITAPYDFTGGSLLFQKWVCYYLDASAASTNHFYQLRRCEATFSGGPTSDLSSAPATSLFSTPSLAAFQASSVSRVVANNVSPSATAFQVNLTDPNCSYDLSLSLESSAAVAAQDQSSKTVSMVLQTRVFPRN